MRYHCHFCGKSVTSELPDDSVIRSILVCPECIENKKIIIPDHDRREHDWQWYMNGTFCKRCGVAIGTTTECK